MNDGAGAGAAGAGGDAGAGAGAVAAAVAGAGAGAGDGAGAAGAGDGGAGAQSWLTGLPAELQGDATLTRYGSVEDLARGHLEAHRTAKAKAPIAFDAAVENFDVFAGSRPPEATAYEIGVPEGMDAGYADWFRGEAHKVGLHPAQAKALAEANNAFVAQQAAAAEADLGAFKTEFNAKGGNYDASLQSVAEMLAAVTPGNELASLNALEASVKSRPAMELLFALAKNFAEPPAGGGEGGGGAVNVAGMTPAQATEQRRALLKDPEFVKQAKVTGTPQHKLYNDLIAAEAGPQKT